MSEAPPRRRRNPEQTRAALVTSALALVTAGSGDPTAKEVAAHAGTSERSVYVHFPVLDDLRTAVAERQAELVRALVTAIDPTGPLADRIDEAVAQSMAIYRLQRNVRPAGLISALRVPAIDASMAGTESLIRANWARTFEPELARSDDPGLLDAVDTALAWSTIFHLIERRRLTEAACNRTQARMLDALFGTGAATP
ncbi:hypothetical protein TPB0596_01390 [Tsukamurella pulmonis]|uniref:DNA-binding transcriptional regulator, AcrR family n=1 Tax=Tsukamurella pulmonis TaxID=47312 RepID=A0A1H1HVK0_9ACTN|nr:TetR/AcrR family transcriptional regulator [Tsukamurella pulmonis]BDD80376.1 hypothetical protein TPB0596_01390 [Tsukamurella pulmonis]SDR29440.1 DNA-binding transcriptional regulator, AcrR family [Tsukamurella pulmonis]SUP12990.1 Uncharacterised protein [Tsukamurella pulmonis]